MRSFWSSWIHIRIWNFGGKLYHWIVWGKIIFCHLKKMFYAFEWSPGVQSSKHFLIRWTLSFFIYDFDPGPFQFSLDLRTICPIFSSEFLTFPSFCKRCIPWHFSTGTVAALHEPSTICVSVAYLSLDPWPDFFTIRDWKCTVRLESKSSLFAKNCNKFFC